MCLSHPSCLPACSLLLGSGEVKSTGIQMMAKALLPEALESRIPAKSLQLPPGGQGKREG